MLLTCLGFLSLCMWLCVCMIWCACIHCAIVIRHTCMCMQMCMVAIGQSGCYSSEMSCVLRQGLSLSMDPFGLALPSQLWDDKHVTMSDFLLHGFWSSDSGLHASHSKCVTPWDFFPALLSILACFLM